MAQRGLNIVKMQNIVFVKSLVLGHLANVSKMDKTGKRQGLDYLGCIRGFLWAMLVSSYRGKRGGMHWWIKLNSSRMACLFLFHIFSNHLDKAQASDSWVQTGELSIKSVTPVVGKYIFSPPHTLYFPTSHIYLVILSMEYDILTRLLDWNEARKTQKRLKEIEWNNQSYILNQSLLSL